MVAYNEILDSEIDPESPVTESLATRLRDNPIAIAEGDPDAPSINPAAIEIGGKSADGILNDATAFSSIGYYDFEGMTITAPKTIPECSFVRVKVPAGGTAVLSSTITVPCLSRTVATNTAQRAQIQDWLAGLIGNDATGSGTTGGGGGSAGAGGSGFGIGGAAKPPGGLSRAWVTRRPFIGGNGFLTSGGGAGLEWGPGGGCLILIVEGDLLMTGGTISVDGGHTNNNGAGSNQPGGGGAGSLIVICTGTITDGTFNCRGGNANQAPGGVGQGGGGGGGYIQLVASAFLGAQTISVAGGSSDSAAGSAGYSNSLTITRDQIRTLLQRL